MIKMMRIKNIESFLQLTDESRGDVTMHLPDGSECDLKRNTTAREMLRAFGVRNELNITLSDKHDLPMFLYYMATECA